MHALLIISLLFGELAASVHLVGHLHEHEHHHEHVHEHASKHTDASEGMVDRDCGIYHAFSGLQACLAAATEPAARRFSVVASATFHIGPAIANALAASRIRGPPAIS